MENSTFVYNQTGKLSKNTFTKEHYTFKGWSTKSNSTEVVYNDEAEVKNLTDVYHGVVNLYAVWKINSYDVNVVVQNGTISGETSKQVEYNQTTTFNVMANINYGRPTISCTNGQSATIENGIVTTGKITNDTTCTVTYIANPIVNVVVQNGTVDTGTKSIEHGQNGIFNLTPEVSGSLPTVTCTNSQTGSITNNVLTVSNVTNDTICTVKYITEMTTLYADGTLIINENLANRSSNITTHGAVTNEYDAMSSSNSYVMSSYSSQPWTNEKESITAVEIGSEIQPVSTNYWAYGLENMTTGDFTKLDTSSVTSMSWMFSFAGYSATTFDISYISNWNTSSVTDMSSMFEGAGYSATTFDIGDLSSWDTSSVTNMKSMFRYAGYSATTFELDLSSWNTSSVKNMSYMFDSAGRSATTWSIGDLSSWNTSSVTSMSYMFNGAGRSASTFNLTGLNNWNTSSVTGMSHMFDFAVYSATTFELDLSSWNTSSVKNMSYMFDSAGRSATTFNIGDLSSWDTSSVTDMRNMFNYVGWKATWSLNCTSWNVNNVTSYSNFNTGVSSKVTPPTWVN